MAQLFLIRHAQASFGAQNYDLLSDLGHEQSRLLGKYFASRQISLDCIITGDMVRHKQTAKGITDCIDVPVKKSDGSWNEFDFDKVVTAYLTLYPSHKPSPDAPRSEWYKVLRSAMVAWSKNQINNPTETWLEFTTRVNAGSQKVLSGKHKNIAVVTSGGAMAIFMMQILNLTVDQAIGLNLQIKNTSVNQFFMNTQGFQLHSFNHVPHLDHPEHMSKITYS